VDWEASPSLHFRRPNPTRARCKYGAAVQIAVLLFSEPTHDVVLDVPAQATAIALGVLLTGTGEVFIADFNLETVGLDVDTTEMDVPLPERPQNLDFSES